jgi:hypothetical protein
MFSLYCTLLRPPQQISYKIQGDLLNQGYLFISTPADACKVVLSPPKFPTPNWILLAETGRCSNQRKASKAFERGYKAIIIFSSESNETGWQDSAPFELPTFFVGEKEAGNLRHNFSYPGL